MFFCVMGGRDPRTDIKLNLFCSVKQNEAQSNYSESTNKGVNLCSKDITQTKQQLESPTVFLILACDLIQGT